MRIDKILSISALAVCRKVAMVRAFPFHGVLQMPTVVLHQVNLGFQFRQSGKI
jgi:hypothetical protein